MPTQKDPTYGWLTIGVALIAIIVLIGFGSCLFIIFQILHSEIQNQRVQIQESSTEANSSKVPLTRIPNQSSSLLVYSNNTCQCYAENITFLFKKFAELELELMALKPKKSTSNKTPSSNWECDSINGVASIEYSKEKSASGLCSSGWLVIHQRKDGSIDFVKNWKSYKSGFSNPMTSSEFWWGLEKVHLLTNSEKFNGFTVRFEVRTLYGNTYYSQANSFQILNESYFYTMVLNESSIQSNIEAGIENLKYHNGTMFSTPDKTNDELAEKHPKSSCTVVFPGGWWFRKCLRIFLTGFYEPIGNQLNSAMSWTDLPSHQDNLLVQSRILIKPLV